MINRAIIIVLDGFGVGELPDAHVYGDEGSNTLVGIYNSEHPNLPNMKSLGLYNIDGVDIADKAGNVHSLSFRMPVAIVLGLPDGLKEFPVLLRTGFC